MGNVFTLACHVVGGLLQDGAYAEGPMIAVASKCLKMRIVVVSVAHDGTRSEVQWKKTNLQVLVQNQV